MRQACHLSKFCSTEYWLVESLTAGPALSLHDHLLARKVPDAVVTELHTLTSCSGCPSPTHLACSSRGPPSHLRSSPRGRSKVRDGEYSQIKDIQRGTPQQGMTAVSEIKTIKSTLAAGDTFPPRYKGHRKLMANVRVVPMSTHTDF